MFSILHKFAPDRKSVFQKKWKGSEAKKFKSRLMLGPLQLHGPSVTNALTGPLRVAP